MREFSVGMTKKKLFTRVVGIVLSTILIFACVDGKIDAQAAKPSNTAIREKEAEVAKIKEQNKELKNKKSELEKAKKKLEAAKADLAAYVKELDTTMVELQDHILELQEQTKEKKAEVEETTKELEEAQATEEAQYAAMIARMRMMYEQGDSYFVDMLIKAKSLRDLLNRSDYIDQVVTYDRNMWEEYKATKEYVALCKEQLEAEMEVLTATEKSLEEEKEALQELIDEKREQIASYNAEIRDQETAIGEIEGDMNAATEEIKILEKAIAEERKRLLEENGSAIKYDGGTFKFPLASYTRISDEYGWRIHPTLKTKQFHNGVDFAAPYGTAIYAAYDGKVVAAAYSSTMGNYVMIDHGDGLFTIYMHASSLSVSSGNLVAKGDKIAAVGSTGRSTGNHLHFSVRVNGDYTSPWNYLK